MTIISSRTPEGQPNHCPVCNADVCLEPSPLFADATCPKCGSLLWFLHVNSEYRVFERASTNHIRDRVIRVIGRQLGVDPAKISSDTSFVNDLGADSLDTVDLIMELEEESGLS